MSLKNELPYVLRDAYQYAVKASTSKEFKQMLVNSRFIDIMPPQKTIDTPQVGSIITTTITSGNFQVVEVRGDRLRAHRVGTGNIIQIGRHEVAKIVNGKMVHALQYDIDPQWLEEEYAKYLISIKHSFLTEYYNKVKRQVKRQKSKRPMSSKSRDEATLDSIRKIRADDKTLSKDKHEPNR
jgi:hypothetical protein